MYNIIIKMLWKFKINKDQKIQEKWKAKNKNNMKENMILYLINEKVKNKNDFFYI